MIGWVHMGILTGLTALAVPVVIHLLRSRRFRTADLGTLRFLREAVEESARWRRLRDLLLLLLRLLAIVLLTLLFARPFVTRRGAAADRDQETVVLADVSGSMNGRLLGGRAWDVARRRVDAVLHDLPPSGRVTLAAFADSVRGIPDWDAFAPTPGGGTDYAGALRWARKRLELSSARHRQVVLVTDLQTAGLPAVRPPDWPEDIPVRVVSIPPAGSGNTGIAEVRCLTPFPKDKAVVRVRLETCGILPVDSANLILDFGDGKPLRRTVPLTDSTVDFTIPGKPGLCRGTARLDIDDEYPADNQRPFAFFLRSPAPVLLLDGAPGKTPFESETYFLAKVLETARTDQGRSAYAVVTAIEPPPSLRRYAAVALCNVASLPSARIRDLAAFVRRGGGLVIFLGGRCRPAAYAKLRRAGIFPLRFRPRQVAVPSPWLKWDVQHPALRLFSGPETGNLSRLVFRDAFAIEPDKNANVPARLAGDAPALLTARVGAGRVVVVTNPCTREWTNWPTERIFLPLMRELFHYAATRSGEAVRPVVELPPASTRKPGVLLEKKRVVVVAPAAREIDVTPCEEKFFRQALALPPPSPGQFDEQSAGLPPGRERKNEIWRWLALALLGALLLENTLADRGRPG